MKTRSMKRIMCAMFALSFVMSSCGNGAQGDSSGVLVKVGDCSNSNLSQTVDKVDLVPCDKPHSLEAYSIIASTATTYPGAEALQVFATRVVSISFLIMLALSYRSQSFITPTCTRVSLHGTTNRIDRSFALFTRQPNLCLRNRSKDQNFRSG